MRIENRIIAEVENKRLSVSSLLDAINAIKELCSIGYLLLQIRKGSVRSFYVYFNAFSNFSK